MPAVDMSAQFVVCIENTAYPAALERRKMYQILPDPAASNHGLLRVVDESGEDYLYPAHYFIVIDLPPGVKEQLLQAA